MNQYLQNIGVGLLGKLVDFGVAALEGQNLGDLTPAATVTTQRAETAPQKGDVATACVACAVNHFSTSAGLLNEAVRFKKDGITSNEIIDRVAKVLEEQNALERVDLTPEKIRSSPEWERDIVEEALLESRSLRHRLETLTTIEDLEQAAADTETYYRKLNRTWWKGRFANLGSDKAELIADKVGTLGTENKERIKKRAVELIEKA